MARLTRNIIFAAATAALLAAGIACGNDDGCTGNQSSLPLAGFYSSQEKSAISIDSLTIYGIGMPGDTTIVDTATVAQTYLPLNIANNISVFVFRYDQSELAAYNLSDTLSISYKASPYFHSEDCGAMYVYDVEEYSTTHNLIDSVNIPNRHIDNTDRENIQIYFRTSEAEEDGSAEEEDGTQQ